LDMQADIARIGAATIEATIEEMINIFIRVMRCIIYIKYNSFLLTLMYPFVSLLDNSLINVY
jgi:hypothetical protein